MLQCARPANDYDWSAITELHVYGAEVVPDSTYQVFGLSEFCLSTNSLEVTTGTWGDVVDPFSTPGGPTQPTIADVLALVDKWLGGSDPKKAIAQLQPQIPDPSLSVGIADVLRDVDAWLGSAYQFAVPDACP